MKTTLLLIILLAFISSGAKAQVTNYTDQSSLGTPTDPIEISSVNDLIYLSKTQGDWGKSFIQTKDIDFGADYKLVDWDNNGYYNYFDYSGFSPIGNNTSNNSVSRFTGQYDGNGYTISNLFIERTGSGASSEHVGLFGYIQNYGTGFIKNIGLVNCDIEGSKRVGGIAGYARDYQIDNCFVTGKVQARGQDGGGLIGDCREITINNCYTTCTVGGSPKGGIVGYGLTITINNCYSTSTGTSGIIGFSTESTENNCFALDSSRYGGTQKTALELQDIATYTSIATTGLSTAWDFIGNPNDDAANNDHWTIDPTYNNGYPVLSIFPKKHEITFSISDGTSPIIGAEISIAGVSKLSNSEGEANFLVIESDSVPYSVVANDFVQVDSYMSVLESDLIENIVLQAIIRYVITATAEIDTFGTVTGSGTYEQDTEVSLTAIPSEGYYFDKWTSNGVDIGNESPLSFNAVQDSSIVAHFTLHSYEISANAEPSAGGTVDGAGTYGHSATVSLTAAPSEGYYFEKWTANGIDIGNESPLTFDAMKDSTLVAHFTLHSYEISTDAEPSVGGTIDGANTYDHGAEVSLTATPNEGYYFEKWTTNGVDIGNESPLTFDATQDSSVVAHFAMRSYVISASVDIESHGSVTGSDMYNHGSTVIINPIAIEGYKFEKWTSNGINIGNEVPLTFEATQDSIIVAHFVIINQLNNTKITSNTIYPNPVRNQAIVRVALSQTEDVKIAMYDLSGQQVIDFTCERSNNGLHDFVLDVSSLNNGVYMLRVDAGSSSVHKLIIER